MRHGSVGMRCVWSRALCFVLVAVLVGLVPACVPAAKRAAPERVPPMSETAFDEFASSVAERIVASVRASRDVPVAIAPPRVSAGGVEPLWIASNFATALSAALNDRLGGAARIGSTPAERAGYRSAVQFARSTRDPQARAVAFALWDADDRLMFRETRAYAAGVLATDARSGDAAAANGRDTTSARDSAHRNCAPSASESVVGRGPDPPATELFALDMDGLRAALLARAESLRSRTRVGVDGAVVFVDACAADQVALASQYWSASPEGHPRAELRLRAKRAARTVVLRVLFLDEHGVAVSVTPVVPVALVPDYGVTIALAAEDAHAGQFVALVACESVSHDRDGAVRGLEQR